MRTFLILLLVSTLRVSGQEVLELSVEDQQLMDSLVDLHFEKSKMTGMVIGFVSEGRVLYKRALGTRELGTDKQETPQSVFHMASISKTFVAIAIMQLVEQGKMILDDKLVKYLPYFKLRDERYKDISIKQILTHTAGLPDVRNYHWDDPQLDDDALETYVKKLSSKGLIAQPGKRHKYSNIGYDILAHVIAVVSGMTFEDYMQENIIEPSGMKESTFYYPEVKEELRNKGHVWKGGVTVSKVYPYNRVHAGSSTLNANLDDMLNFMITYLDQEDGGVLLSAESFELLNQKEFETDPPFGRALGWFLMPSTVEVNDYGMISHSGGDTGFRCWYGMIPEKNWGIIRMYNGDWGIPVMEEIFLTGQRLGEKYN